jgi:Fe(3+) dicitrate transport protein
MEDGILLKPAPYAAPAAYYFPLMTRITELEVFKGPAAVVAGPNTIGGAINLKTREVPEGTVARLDVAGGNTSYVKLHGYAGTGNEVWGVLFEGVHLSTTGFKDLPTDANTGFARNDLMFKARLNTRASAELQHRLDLKLGWGSEVSDETYLGITDEDFRADPFQRYAASELDRMEWDRGQVELAYTTGQEKWKLRVAGYYHPFSRVWRRLDRFESPARPSFNDVLRSTDPSNRELVDVLRGARDSAVVGDANLLLTINDRTFGSQGVQAAFDAELSTGPLAHIVEAGARFHHDWIERDQPLIEYQMQSGRMLPTGRELPGTENRDSVLAGALYLKDTVSWGKLSVSPGVRTELIQTRREEDSPDSPIEQFDTAILPGVGVLYELLPGLSILGGVHRGFSPVAPGQRPTENDEGRLVNVEPETSWNWEAGVRFDQEDLFAEAIGFFNDYENIVANCTFSSGCPNGGEGRAGSLGAASIYGVEANARMGTEGPFGFRYDLHLTYTYTEAQFDDEISASFNPRFAGAQPGDTIPDIPAHMGSFYATVASGDVWALSLGGFAQSRMIDVVEQGRDELGDAFYTDAFFVLDATAHYRPIPWLDLYVGGQNLLDNEYIASRRPFGARPGRPLFVYAGLKLTYDGAPMF